MVTDDDTLQAEAIINEEMRTIETLLGLASSVPDWQRAAIANGVTNRISARLQSFIDEIMDREAIPMERRGAANITIQETILAALKAGDHAIIEAKIETTVCDAIHPSPGRTWKAAFEQVWHELEDRARTTLLVHGSAAVAASERASKNHGVSIDPIEVIAAMTEANVLRPLKVDFAGAHISARANADFFYEKPARYVASQPWSEAHALLWTYEPVNRAPMRSKP